MIVSVIVLLWFICCGVWCGVYVLAALVDAIKGRP